MPIINTALQFAEKHTIRIRASLLAMPQVLAKSAPASAAANR
jgi:hypothetical protein